MNNASDYGYSIDGQLPQHKETRTMNRTVVCAIASRLDAMVNCVKTGNVEWEAKHSETIASLVDQHFPHGSGFDNGTSLNVDHSEPERLVFDTSFHHMDTNGYYDGWSQHTVIVKPSLILGYTLRITGRNRNDIKDYIAEAFRQALDTITTD
jgi:hypothetical protein